MKPSAKRVALNKLALTSDAIEALEPADKPWVAWDDKLTGFVIYDLILCLNSRIATPPGGRMRGHRAHRCLCGACATVTGAVFPVWRSTARGPVRATHHRLGELPAVRPVRSREALGAALDERPLRSCPSLRGPAITAHGLERTARRFRALPRPWSADADPVHSGSRSSTSTKPACGSPPGRRWLHVLCTPFLTVLRIGVRDAAMSKRETVEGILIHDDYAAYFTLKARAPRRLQRWHHLFLRTPGPEATSRRKTGQRACTASLKRAHRATRFSRENGRDVPALPGGPRHLAGLGPHPRPSHRPLARGSRTAALMDRRSAERKKRRIGHNLALRLRKHKESMPAIRSRLTRARRWYERMRP